MAKKNGTGSSSKGQARRAKQQENAERKALQEKIFGDSQKAVDSAQPDAVGSEQLRGPQAITQAGGGVQEQAQPAGEKTMTLTLKGLSKNGKTAFYAGAAQVVRLTVGSFVNKQAPQAIEVPDGLFAPPSAPKPKETKEERKARLAALPKPTLAERIAKREAQLAKDKAKLEAAQKAEAAQPSL